MGRSLLLLAALLFLAGCARAISSGTMEQVDQNVTFEMLRGNPEAYVGKQVLLGGTINEVRNTGTGAWLEVNQRELDFGRRPKETKTSGGKFIASTGSFLDPLIYGSGDKVTVAGKVTGKSPGNLPVISITEMQLFRDEPYGMTYQYTPMGTYRYRGERK